MNELRRKEETMTKKMKILAVIVLLASALFSLGCEGYRGAATASLDRASQFVVTRFEDTVDCDVMSQEENEETDSKPGLIAESRMVSKTAMISPDTNTYGLGLRWRM